MAASATQQRVEFGAGRSLDESDSASVVGDDASVAGEIGFRALPGEGTEVAQQVRLVAIAAVERDPDKGRV